MDQGKAKRTVTVFTVKDSSGVVVEHLQDRDAAEELAEAIGGTYKTKEMDPDEAEELF